MKNNPPSAVPAATAEWVTLPKVPTDKMLTELFRGYVTREAAYAAMIRAVPPQAEPSKLLMLRDYIQACRDKPEEGCIDTKWLLSQINEILEQT